MRLEFEQTRKDNYNRSRAHVYLTDGTFVNAEMIRQGYGLVDAGYPFQYLADFRQLEREAREGRRGQWALFICSLIADTKSGTLGDPVSK